MSFENSENNENKNTFENKIKDWVLLDNKIHNLNEELKNLKERKDLLNNDINNYMNINMQRSSFKSEELDINSQRSLLEL